MPMATTLFAVSAETLARLKAEPDAITALDSKDTYSTYLWVSIPYFLAWDEDEDDEDEDEDEDESEAGPLDQLADVLTGTDSVNCERLECGSFSVFEPSDVATLSAALAAVNLGAIKERVLNADLEEVFDGEVWEELEQQDLSDPEEVAKAVVDDIKRLKTFYAAVAKKKLGLVGYTT
jgi:hypothetical protein